MLASLLSNLNFKYGYTLRLVTTRYTTSKIKEKRKFCFKEHIKQKETIAWHRVLLFSHRVCTLRFKEKDWSCLDSKAFSRMCSLYPAECIQLAVPFYRGHYGSIPSSSTETCLLTSQSLCHIERAVLREEKQIHTQPPSGNNLKPSENTWSCWLAGSLHPTGEQKTTALGEDEGVGEKS